MTKYEADIIIHPKVDEVIVIRFNDKELDYDMVKNAFDLVTRKFPDNKVIALPSEVSINTYSKEECKELLDSIKNNIDKFLNFNEE